MNAQRHKVVILVDQRKTGRPRGFAAAHTALWRPPTARARDFGRARAGPRQSVSLEDLAGQTVVGGANPGYRREALVPTTPSGKPIPIGPHVTSTEQMFPIISTGEAISPIHGHAVRYLKRPDIILTPIHDAPRAQWALIWRTAAETEPTRAFAEAVTDHGPLAL